MLKPYRTCLCVQEIAQRQWYGFWDYGDVMHTYGKFTEILCHYFQLKPVIDQTRHTWRYDVGGYVRAF